MERRIGRFVVSAKFIREEPQQVLAALQGIIVVRAEYHYADDCIHYSGLHAQFEPVAEMVEAPRYTAIQTEDGVKWERE